MQVVHVSFIDGKAERGDVFGDALGSEQYIAREALYRLIIIVELARLGGLMRRLICAAVLARGLAGIGSEDGGVVRPIRSHITMLLIRMLRVHRGAPLSFRDS